MAEALTYLRNNKDRMRYDEYRKAGLPIVLPLLKLECRAGWVSINLIGGISMRKSRRHFSAEQKAQIVRRHSAAKSLSPTWPTSSAFSPA